MTKTLYDLKVKAYEKEINKPEISEEEQDRAEKKYNDTIKFMEKESTNEK